MTPTIETYTVLQAAFDHFNAELFEEDLPQCIITLRGAYYQSDICWNEAGVERTRSTRRQGKDPPDLPSMPD